MSAEVPKAVKEWLDQADEDRRTTEILLADAEPPARSACFHSQQHVEKLLKGFLTSQGIEAPRTHDLSRLLQLAQPHLPELGALAAHADELTRHAVETRYPPPLREVTVAEARESFRIAQQFAAVLVPKLRGGIADVPATRDAGAAEAAADQGTCRPEDSPPQQER